MEIEVLNTLKNINHMNKETNFLYLVTYIVGAKRQQFIVKNHMKIPHELLTTMAHEKIEHEIEKMYHDSSIKQRNKLLKQSSIEIEDLTELVFYELNLKFEENGEIKNRPVEA